MMPVSASHCGGCGGLRRGNHASLAGDAAIMLDAAVALEIEYRLLAENRRVEIAVRGDELVALGCRLRDDLAVRVDDHAAGNQGMAVLAAALRHRDYPG